jgi:nitrite reductase/ring-hydroxylating ferredoxin subunit
VVGRDVAMGFIPIGPLLTLTCDYRPAQNELRQVYSVGGLFLVLLSISVVALETGGSRCDLEWTVASKWYLKPLQSVLLKRIQAMNARVTVEDQPVRTRRQDLRERGYRFIDDDVDYFSASQLYPTNVQRPAAPPAHVNLRSLPLDGKSTVRSEGREFVVWRKSEREVLVWDGVCPHQGGPIEPSCLSGDQIVCPWHGLAIPGVRVSDACPATESSAFALTLGQDEITITPR